MKNVKLGKLVPFQFQEKLIIALDEKWLTCFTKKDLAFFVEIKNEKFVLEGPTVIKDLQAKTSQRKKGVVSNVK